MVKKSQSAYINRPTPTDFLSLSESDFKQSLTESQFQTLNPHSELPACSTKRYMNYYRNLSQQIKQINSIPYSAPQRYHKGIFKVEGGLQSLLLLIIINM